MQMRTAWTTVLLLHVGAAMAAPDAAPQRYAVVSRIGDALSVVQYRAQTGSHIPSNLSESVPTPSHEFDRTALRAARFALHRADGAAPITLLAPPPSDPYPIDDPLVDDRTFSPSDAVKDALAKAGSTRVVLITKHRSNTAIRYRDGTMGNGTLEGLGFYVDNVLKTKSGTGNYGVGFIAPFVYIAVTLIDTSTRQVIAQEFITSSAMIGAGAADNNHDAWGALSAEQKERALNRILEREVPKTIAALLAKD